MQNVNQATALAIERLDPVKMFVYKSGVKLTTGIRSIQYNHSVGDSNTYCIGSCNSAEVDLVLDTVGLLTKGDNVKITWSASGQTEYPLMFGVVHSVKEDDDSSTIKIYDKIYYTGNANYEPNSTNLKTELQSIATAMGVSLNSGTATLAENVTVDITAFPDQLELAKALSEYACVLGGNAIINRNGELEVKVYNNTDKTEIPYSGGLDIEKSMFDLTGIAFITKSNDEDSGVDTVTYYAGTAPYCEFESTLGSADLVTNAWDNIKNVPDYYVGSASFAGGLLYEVGDIVSMEKDSESHNMKCDGITISYDGGCKTDITSYGRKDIITGGTISQKIQSISHDVAEATLNSESAKVAADRAETAINTINTSQGLLELLSNNSQGVFYGDDGKLYIDADFIKSGSISANYIKTGDLVSDNFVYSSGDFSTSGSSISLENGTILTPYLSVLQNGAHFNGSVDMYDIPTVGYSWLKRIGAKFENDYFRIYAVPTSGSEKAMFAIGPSEGSSSPPHAYTDYDCIEFGPALHITGTADASGTANNNAPLKIGNDVGEHLEFDSNEIMAKSDSTTPSTLHLNADGGIVTVGYVGHNSELRINGHDSGIGDMVDKTTTTAYSVANNAWSDVDKSTITATIGAGSWIAHASIAFASGAGSRRGVRLIVGGTNSVTGSTNIAACPNVSTNLTVQSTAIFTLASRNTITVQGFQNSGAALNATSVSLRIMRIA